MKRAVILHGTGATPQSNWFPWLKTELETRGYEVWVPQLPNADRPDASAWTKSLLESDWDFQDSLLIGHSAGAVEILHLLQYLDDDVRVRGAVLAGSFTRAIMDKPGWDMLAGLFKESLDFERIKTKVSKRPLFLHGDNDPHCDPKNAQWLAGQVNGNYVEIPNGQHFSLEIGPEYDKFPQLIAAMESADLL